ncbi:MAG: Lrp/AsnC family transcriptional regulator [Candidatus Bathyarchaeia archaeon]
MAKQKMVDLLYELMKDSKRSDRELAKVVGVSQPTITRMRKTLEKQEYIREYTVMPALEKLGFEILALNFIAANITQEFTEWISKNPKIIYAGFGEGLEGKNLLLASVHKNFTDFSEFTREIKSLFGSNISFFKSFLSSLNVDVIKHFSFKNLERVK